MNSPLSTLLVLGALVVSTGCATSGSGLRLEPAPDCIQAVTPQSGARGRTPSCNSPSPKRRAEPAVQWDGWRGL